MKGTLKVKLYHNSDCTYAKWSRLELTHSVSYRRKSIIYGFDRDISKDYVLGLHESDIGKNRGLEDA